MAPNFSTFWLDTRPGKSNQGAEDVSLFDTAARQSLFPSAVHHVCSNIAPTTLVFVFIATTLTLIYTVKSSSYRLSLKPIGLSRRSRRLSTSKECPFTSHYVEEDLGPEHKTGTSSRSHPATLPFTPPAPDRLLLSYAPFSEAAQTTAMANSAPVTPLLRPQAGKPTPHAGPSATISLRQGRYQGVLLPASSFSPATVTTSSSSSLLPRAVEAWRGIPYAQSTGGQNRFRPPVPLPPYDAAKSGGGGEEVVRADRFGLVCPGSAAGFADASFAGEDCLNLNVYRPAGVVEQQQQQQPPLPVVVYVHGGAFNTGAGTERDMASFVGWAATPVLAVSFNYRVGALGFPSSAAADAAGCLNLGLRDQRMLFEWVRDNVGAFGGDAGRVTLMGMSAGAHSIGYHLQYYTDPATAPFHGAIMESGGATARATLSVSHPRTETQWREFLVAAGIQPGSTAPGELFSRLRALPLDVVVHASTAVFARYQDPIRWPFQPVIESSSNNNNNNDSSSDRTIPDLPIARFRRGEFLRVPVLTGFNTNEGSVFCSPRVGDRDDDFLAKFTTMIPGLGAADLAELRRVYPDPTADADGGSGSGSGSPYAEVPPGFGRQWSRYEAAYAHYAYICPVLQSGHFYSNGGDDGSGPRAPAKATEKESPPVWVYHFAALSRPDFGGKANHVDEAALASHDARALAPFPGLLRTADAMHGAWVRFVATGNPNPPTATAGADAEWWPRFTSPLLAEGSGPHHHQQQQQQHGRVMLFGAGNDERMGGAGRGSPGTPAQVVGLTPGEVEQCRYWWERVELSEGMGTRLGRAVKSRL